MRAMCSKVLVSILSVLAVCAVSAVSPRAAGVADTFPPYSAFSDGGAGAPAQAQGVSDKLEAYVDSWMAGKASRIFKYALDPSDTISVAAPTAHIATFPLPDVDRTGTFGAGAVAQTGRLDAFLALQEMVIDHALQPARGLLAGRPAEDNRQVQLLGDNPFLSA